MRFRVSGRHDSLLLAGFAFALLLVFQRSLQYLLNIATDIERTYGVALVPALLVLSVMFVFHLHANRREMRAEAAAAAAEARLARAQAAELAELMTFGQALSRALTVDALHEAVWRHLPILAKGTDIWVLLRREGEWERVTDRGHARWRSGELEAIADRIVRLPSERLASGDAIPCDGFMCHVITVGGAPAGIVGIGEHHASEEARRAVGTAITLVGIALRNVQLFAEVRATALRDELTGCFNRAHALESLEAELTRSRRTNAPLSVIMLDIDHFKRINDEHGHLFGDQVLAAIGHRLRQVLRRSDLRCRYGGDEFLILLPETPAAGAPHVAEWLRSELGGEDVSADGVTIRPSVSIGVATCQPGDRAEALVDRADRALYAAKAAGRNCVRVAFSAPRAVVPAAVVNR
jgi:diguanylate cyclase (GGDEF)-like protein